MKRIILLVCALAFAPAFANTHAQNLVDVLNAAAPDSLTCSVKSKSKTIMCIVNVDAGELDKVAHYVVFQANSMDIPLAGWKITMVNPDDYVVTRRF